MNAPLPANIEQDDAGVDVVPDNLIKETQLRQDQIGSNGVAAAETLHIVQRDFAKLVDTMSGVREGLRQSAAIFSKLEESSEKSAESFFALATEIRKLSAAMKVQAGLLSARKQ